MVDHCYEKSKRAHVLVVFEYQDKELNLISKVVETTLQLLCLMQLAPGLMDCVQLKAYSDFGIFIFLAEL